MLAIDGFDVVEELVLDANDALASRTLRELGLRDRDVLAIVRGGDTRHVELRAVSAEEERR